MPGEAAAYGWKEDTCRDAHQGREHLPLASDSEELPGDWDVLGKEGVCVFLGVIYGDWEICNCLLILSKCLVT